MSLLAAVEQHLKDANLANFNLIESASELATVLTRSPQAGVNCWVVPLGERPEANRHTAGPALQKINITFGVVIAVRSVNDRRGNRGSDALEAARLAVRNQLFGWLPANALTPTLLGASDLIKMEQATLWWMDRYTTSVQYRAKHS